jgi:hypothetical protein
MGLRHILADVAFTFQDSHDPGGEDRAEEVEKEPDKVGEAQYTGYRPGETSCELRCQLLSLESYCATPSSWDERFRYPAAGHTYSG